MRQYLFLLALLLTWISGTDSTCNTVWRCRANVYTKGSTYAGSLPQIPDLDACRKTCSRDYPNCTAFEYRKTNCWIQQKPITPENLVNWTNETTVQFYLAQRCNPEFCSANWLEVGTDYPLGNALTDYDKGHRNKCLNLCVTRSSDSSSPCARVFYCPTTGGNFEPFGSSCTLEDEGFDPAPEDCIEYRLLDDCL